MKDIRAASLGAHAAAREVDQEDSAVFAARAAGQAVATAHVTQHAYGAALYALKAVVAADPAAGERNALAERSWQSQRLPAALRHDVMSRINIVQSRRGVTIQLDKSPGF